MSEIMALHALRVKPQHWTDTLANRLLEDHGSRLTDISFSGGSIDEAISYFVELGLGIIEVPPSSNDESYEIFGRSLIILEQDAFIDVLTRLEKDSEAGGDITEDLMIFFEEAEDDLDWQENPYLVIVW